MHVFGLWEENQNTQKRAHGKVPTQLGFEPRNPLSVRHHPGKHKPGNPTRWLFLRGTTDILPTRDVMGTDIHDTIGYRDEMSILIFFKNRKNRCLHKNLYHRYYSCGTILPKSHSRGIWHLIDIKYSQSKIFSKTMVTVSRVALSIILTWSF